MSSDAEAQSAIRVEETDTIEGRVSIKDRCKEHFLGCWFGRVFLQLARGRIRRIAGREGEHGKTQ
jgi:hypothetical protein